jgi:pSer/pThr/pTyr-binding forkhead associated (FHA) protein
MAEAKTICMEALERHCKSGDIGRLDLTRDAYKGQIYVYGGFIVHAYLAGLDGVPALFRLFDWGDAEIVWTPDEISEQSSLNLSMQAACDLYAENLTERASWDSKDAEKLDKAFDTQSLMLGESGALESALKNYTVSLECADKALLPNGFTFSNVDKPSYVIGSSPDCDVVLAHPSVDPMHCGVILENGSVYVWDLGAQSGVRLNGAPIEQGILRVGDVMTLGAVDLQVRFQLRRPTINRPLTVPLPNISARSGPPPKEIPKGAITYEKVSKALRSSDKGQPFLTKLGSMFGGKDKK